MDTQTGVPETQEIVEQRAREHGWPLRIETPPEKSYRQFVLEYGFPGPAAHRFCYIWLKERALRKVIREVKYLKELVHVITGVRETESTRRMGFVDPVQKRGRTIWVSPLHSFSQLDIALYMHRYTLPQSPVKAKLGMSGECLCGAFAKKNEIEIIARFYPEVAARIHALEAEVAKIGKHSVWGTRPPGKRRYKHMPMCASCELWDK